MTFFTKNTTGPDVFGGYDPKSDPEKPCMNRSGSAVVLGDVVMLVASDPAALVTATEITTNDSNSYLPNAGDASGDSVWNTIVNPTAAGIERGGIFGVCLEGVGDNEVVKVQFYGIVDAFVISSGVAQPGDPLTISTANNFDAVVATNEAIFAIYNAPSASPSSRTLTQVFLHSGAIGQNPGGKTGIA